VGERVGTGCVYEAKYRAGKAWLAGWIACNDSMQQRVH
jgi:hypothetical protein